MLRVPCEDPVEHNRPSCLDSAVEESVFCSTGQVSRTVIVFQLSL